MLLDKLNAIETHLEDNFSNLHTQIAELTCKSKQDINIIKSTLHKLGSNRRSTEGILSPKGHKKLPLTYDGWASC